MEFWANKKNPPIASWKRIHLPNLKDSIPSRLHHAAIADEAMGSSGAHLGRAQRPQGRTDVYTDVYIQCSKRSRKASFNPSRPSTRNQQF